MKSFSLRTTTNGAGKVEAHAILDDFKETRERAHDALSERTISRTVADPIWLH